MEDTQIRAETAGDVVTRALIKIKKEAPQFKNYQVSIAICASSVEHTANGPHKCPTQYLADMADEPEKSTQVRMLVNAALAQADIHYARVNEVLPDAGDSLCAYEDDPEMTKEAMGRWRKHKEGE